jgi:integrase
MTSLEPVPDPERSPARASDFVVSDRTVEMILDAPAKNTTDAYDWWWAKFTAWCEEEDRTSLPATPQTLAEYVAYLCGKNAAPPSIWQAISAIRTRHRQNGHRGEPDNEGALLVLRSHKRARAEAGHRAKAAPPVTVKTLRAMVDTCDTSTLIGLRDQLVLVLGLAMMGRRSELVALNQDDVCETDDGLEVFIRKSKTDKDANGELVRIPAGQHAGTDAVRVVAAWRNTLAELGVHDGRLVRSATRHGTVRASMHPATVNTIVQTRARLAGLPNADTYSAHSLRAGGATSAYQGGAPPSAIAAHGRWSINSPVFLGYIRAVDKWKDNPMRGIGL